MLENFKHHSNFPDTKYNCSLIFLDKYTGCTFMLPIKNSDRLLFVKVDQNFLMSLKKSHLFELPSGCPAENYPICFSFSMK